MLSDNNQTALADHRPVHTACISVWDFDGAEDFVGVRTEDLDGVVNYGVATTHQELGHRSKATTDQSGTAFVDGVSCQGTGEAGGVQHLNAGCRHGHAAWRRPASDHVEAASGFTHAVGRPGFFQSERQPGLYVCKLDMYYM